jgi:hypothetical protein
VANDTFPEPTASRSRIEDVYADRGGAVRCHLIRSRLDPLVALPDSLRLFYVAAFCNTLVWGALSGDLVRAWLVSYCGRWDAAVHSVILDRIAALGALAVLVIATSAAARRAAGGRVNR